MILEKRKEVSLESNISVEKLVFFNAKPTLLASTKKRKKKSANGINKTVFYGFNIDLVPKK